MSADSRTVSIVGAGKVGTAIGVLLVRAGYEVGSVWSRTPAHAEEAARLTGAKATAGAADAARSADLVFITTSDDAIAEVCREVAEGGGFSSEDVVFHMSGALGNDVLEPARAAGAQVGSIHPMQSFADVEGALEQLPGAVFGITADGEALRVARQIVDALGGEPVNISPQQKILYHAAACIVSNYLVTLADYAEELYRAIDVDPAVARRAYAPLIHGTETNIARRGPGPALTGPIVRGDVEVVRRHLARMADSGIDSSLYRLLGARATAIARRRGAIADDVADRLLAVLCGGENATRLSSPEPLPRDQDSSQG